jgi:hypothetical protein
LTDEPRDPEQVDEPNPASVRSTDAGDAGTVNVEEPDRIISQEDPSATERTSRDVLYEAIGLQLVGAGVLMPAREFVDEVRAAAGTRVSPRQIAAIVTQMSQSGSEVTPATVAELAQSATGDRSQRQQRNADEWRELGAALTLRGLDGSTNGQRAFVGGARRIAGKGATDALILRIALALSELGAALDMETVGKLGKRLVASAPDIPEDSFTGIVGSELRTLIRTERTAAITTRKTRSSSGARRKPSTYLHNPGARKLRPGRRKSRKRGMT